MIYTALCSILGSLDLIKQSVLTTNGKVWSPYGQTHDTSTPKSPPTNASSVTISVIQSSLNSVDVSLDGGTTTAITIRAGESVNWGNAGSSIDFSNMVINTSKKGANAMFVVHGEH